MHKKLEITRLFLSEKNGLEIPAIKYCDIAGVEYTVENSGTAIRLTHPDFNKRDVMVWGGLIEQIDDETTIEYQVGTGTIDIVCYNANSQFRTNFTCNCYIELGN